MPRLLWQRTACVALPNRRYGEWGRSLRWSILNYTASASIWGVTARRSFRAARLCAEVIASVFDATVSKEEEVALRQDGRYIARLTRHALSHGLPVPDQPYRLEVGERGTLDSLQLRPAARRAPAFGEVEIEVQASGLNFRDLLNVLGMYPGDPGPLGAECAGKIAAVGAGVTRFSIGDEVLAMAPASFSQYVTASADYVIRKPAALSAVEAAALPSVFVTAYYGLHELARIKAGDRVLIHAAAGGVGMAAVQLAQMAGARSLRPPAQLNGTRCARGCHPSIQFAQC